MRLKSLTLHGYKSFATKTEILFPPGITAIIGPNGSGKSNIAEAVLWVLGEQRASALRVRRTDELIFGGTRGRSRQGLAEVSLLLDNSDGWLPIDFKQVEITRRAHRDGSNEYLLNRARVRLQDISQLVAAGRTGHSAYSVVGQGLADSALAMRPAERISLIDEAAGIGVLRQQRESALRRLEETRANLQRVRDILDELAPRVRHMERLSKRAREHESLTEELSRLLRVSYRQRAAQARDWMQQAGAASEQARLALDAARQHQDACLVELRRLEDEQDRHGRHLAEAVHDREQAERQLAQAQRELAVINERVCGLEQRLDEARRRAEQDAQRAQELAARLRRLERAHEHGRLDTTAGRGRPEAGQSRPAQAAVKRHVLGRLHELVEVQDGWQAAIGAALGQSLDALIVRDWDAACALAQALAGRTTTSVSLVAHREVTKDHPPPIDDLPALAAEAAVRVLDVGPPRWKELDGDAVRRVVLALLGDCLVVGELTAARDLLRAGLPPGRSRLATRDGVVMSEGGVLRIWVGGKPTLPSAQQTGHGPAVPLAGDMAALQFIQQVRADAERAHEQARVAAAQIHAIESQLQQTLAQSRDQQHVVSRRKQALDELTALTHPFESQQVEWRTTVRQAQDDLEAARRQVTHLEERLHSGSRDAERAQEQLERLSQQAAEDGEWLDLPAGLGSQLVFEMAADADVPLALPPPDLEARIRELRRRLRTLGPVDIEALHEFEEAAQRHSFLLGQSEDLADAERDLIGLLDDLATQLEARFEQHFAEVAARFSHYYPRLTDGGEGRLELTDGDGQRGIEISVRPPAKRRQPLALLSGGERAQTAAALVFALLDASATPFCFLDEVDSMLDEANIDRFRAALTDLAQRTQCVVITHNRGTIECADTIYGLTMGSDGASRVLALRMSQERGE